MARKSVWPVLAAVCAVLLACDFSLIPPAPTATPTLSPSPTATASVTPPPTSTTFPTRTASPTLIPGIEEPVEVGEARLLVTKALRRDAFRCGEESIAPEVPDDEEFLVILFDVVRGPSLTSAELEEWIRDNDIDRITLDVRARSGRGSVEKYSHLCYSRDANSYVVEEIHMAFVIELHAEFFTLILPDGTQIPLDSLLPA